MEGKKSIGEWLPQLGAKLRAKPFWTVGQDEHGTHAMVDLCVLLKAGDTVIGIARLGVVARTGDHPKDASWKAGSMPALEATRLVTDIAKRDYSSLDARTFIGVNCALPWEVPQPQAWWRQLGRWLCFWERWS